MANPALILFDDGRDLAPLTDMRASFELRTGAATTMQRLTRQLQIPVAALFAPPALAELVTQRWTVPVNRLPDADVASYLLMNGRCTSLPADRPDFTIATALVDRQGDVIAAHLNRNDAQTFLDARQLASSVTIRRSESTLLAAPWQMLEHIRVNLPGDLATCVWPAFSSVSPTLRIIGEHSVRVADSARISPMVVLDSSAGDIVIDEHAVIEPFVVLQGPCHIGPHCTIIAHAHIRPFTVIGEYCKIGGEINACIFHGYSNKAHLGFLGNSIVGQWVNLGAGTTTSNLKNTYGQVAMQTSADSPAQPTGMTFLGSILGDHVKTAIGTRLTTGSCIGTGAMIACSSFPPKYLDRFAFVTDRCVARYDFEKFCEVAGRVMGRRDVKLTQAESDRLKQLYSTIRV